MADHSPFPGIRKMSQNSAQTKLQGSALWGWQNISAKERRTTDMSDSTKTGPIQNSSEAKADRPGMLRRAAGAISGHVNRNSPDIIKAVEATVVIGAGTAAIKGGRNIIAARAAKKATEKASVIGMNVVKDQARERTASSAKGAIASMMARKNY